MIFRLISRGFIRTAGNSGGRGSHGLSRPSVVPHDSQISWASESRGTNPFTEFIEHQQKLIVMMATGGTLATLSEATGIGGGASDVQQDEWKRNRHTIIG